MGSLREIDLVKSQSAYSNVYNILGLALASNTFSFNSSFDFPTTEKKVLTNSFFPHFWIPWFWKFRIHKPVYVAYTNWMVKHSCFIQALKTDPGFGRKKCGCAHGGF